jgi:hypothetical protein
MNANKSVLLIGIDPYLAGNVLPSGMDAAKVDAVVQADKARLTDLGYAVDQIYTDLGATAEAVVAEQLQKKAFDCVLIGAGIRVPPPNFLLFEKLINLIHERAPQAKLCFNTDPGNTLDAVKRWV